VPAFPGTSHAWHWPPHAESQHTPSTHEPLSHSAFAAQAFPSSFPHVPGCSGALQTEPAGHVAVSQQAPPAQ
jgi:hypothetical protein